jgi:hypothetical protein
MEILKTKNYEETNQENELHAKFDGLRKKNEYLKDDLNRPLRRDTAKELLITLHEEPDKIPCILVYGENLTVYSQGEQSEKSFDQPQKFFEWVRTRDKAQEYVVLFVRPSRFEGRAGANDYTIILDKLYDMEFDVGLHVIDEKTKIIPPRFEAP